MNSKISRFSLKFGLFWEIFSAQALVTKVHTEEEEGDRGPQQEWASPHF
jgi:hypothetical protein